MRRGSARNDRRTSRGAARGQPAVPILRRPWTARSGPDVSDLRRRVPLVRRALPRERAATRSDQATLIERPDRMVGELRREVRGEGRRARPGSATMLNRFGGAPVDEVDLARRVAPDVERLRGTLPDAGRLCEVMASEGIDFATMLFYQAIHSAPLHGDFVRLIDGLPAAAAAGPAAGKLLVVPAMFYRERPA